MFPRLLFIVALLVGCTDSPDPEPSLDASVMDAQLQDAARLDAYVAPDGFVEIPFGPQVPHNPYGASDAFASQHGDLAASDTSPLPGPGARVTTSVLSLLAVCPSILPRKDGILFVVCTQILNQTQAVFLIDPKGPTRLTSYELVKGDLFGGVYPFLDQNDRLVVVDGANSLLRFEAKNNNGSWSLSIAEQTSLGEAISAKCGFNTCDGVVGLAPDYQGNVWYATATGLLGIAGKGALDLKEGIFNSIAIAPEGTAVATDHALYLLTAGNGTPQLKLRAEYDRGTARKPGQLSWSSGTTPTFFGPRTGSEYVAILDNARPTMNLLVYRTSGDTTPVCKFALPAGAGDGTEDKPISAGRSVIVSSTYGYPFLALPANAGTSEPASAPFVGGMARVDVMPDESCKLIWTNTVRSVALPKLSIPDRQIYTFERQLALAPDLGPFDSYAYTAIDVETGKVTTSQVVPNSPDVMQLTPTIAQNGVLFVGSTGSLIRVAPSP